MPLELQQAVQQVGHIAQVVEEIAHAGAQEAWCDVGIAVDYGQEHPLVETVVEVIDAAVPRLQRVIHVERGERRPLEFALVQARVELELGQRLLEAIGIDRHRLVGLAVVGIGDACAHQRGEQQKIFSHGRTPAWRRR